MKIFIITCAIMITTNAFSQQCPEMNQVAENLLKDLNLNLSKNPPANYKFQYFENIKYDSVFKCQEAITKRNLPNQDFDQIKKNYESYRKDCDTFSSFYEIDLNSNNQKFKINSKIFNESIYNLMEDTDISKSINNVKYYENSDHQIVLHYKDDQLKGLYIYDKIVQKQHYAVSLNCPQIQISKLSTKKKKVLIDCDKLKQEKNIFCHHLKNTQKQEDSNKKSPTIDPAHSSSSSSQ